jgi:3-hydroxyacyl-CoA dehydrogenase
MSELAIVSRDGDIGIVTVNNPPVNALSPAVAAAITAAVAGLRCDDSIRGIILLGGGRTFIAGADIKEFGKLTSGQQALDIGIDPMLAALEDSPKPVVCAIHGTALGGGLETAMACHYRVATADAQVGQPEVKLGLMPGAGGTQRLPRLAGVPKAAELCAGGEAIRAAEALAIGILDRVIDGDLLGGAVAFTREVIARAAPPPRTRDRTEKLGSPATNAAAIAAVRDQVKKRARGLIAPFKALDAV